MSYASLFDGALRAPKTPAAKTPSKQKFNAPAKVPNSIRTTATPLDEWAPSEVTVISAIEWEQRSIVMLAQAWSCRCGAASQTRLGLYLEEFSAKTRCRRLTACGKFAPSTELPVRTEWLEDEHVNLCPQCAEASHEAEPYQLSLPFDREEPQLALVELCEKIIEGMLVAKPGFDNFGAPIHTRARKEEGETLPPAGKQQWVI